MLRVAALALLLAAPATAGVPYLDDDLKVPSPGKDWNTQTQVVDAPNLRAAFVKPRGKGRGSIITFGLDETPNPAEPAKYVEKAFGLLTKPPFGFKVGKKQDFQWKGQTAFRLEYTDAEGARHFQQAAIKTPRGGILIVTLQSPDAKSFGDDVKAFSKLLDGIQLPAKK